PWPVAVGMLSHALRWVAITVLGFGAAIGTLLACLVVGLILTPVARRRHMPFAAIGFASVVSMLPGVLLFRMASGLVQIAGGAPTSLELISATIADGMSALISILAMSLGLITPKLVIDDLSERQTQAKSNKAKEEARLKHKSDAIDPRPCRSHARLTTFACFYLFLLIFETLRASRDRHNPFLPVVIQSPPVAIIARSR